MTTNNPGQRARELLEDFARELIARASEEMGDTLGAKDLREGRLTTWCDRMAFKAVMAGMQATLNPPKHKFWGAGEPDCPSEIKAGNGELHTLRCKVCGEDDPRDDRCLARAALSAAALPDERTIRNAALEEAAAVADRMIAYADRGTPRADGARWAAGTIAGSIRALSGGHHQEQE